jgi:transcriptional regulator with XRE-family HTH domain
LTIAATPVREDQAADHVRRQIRARRTELKLSQKTLAARLGISHQQYQKYEGGADRLSATMLVRIARHLDCSVAALVDERSSRLPTDRSLKPEAIELLQLYAKLPTTQMRRTLIALLAEFVAAHV